MTVRGQRVVRLAVVFIWLAVLILYALPSRTASAATLTSRKLTLQTQGTTGGSTPGGTVKHKFNFTVATTNNVGSIVFQYCTTASGTCTGPTGLDVNGVTLDDQNGATGFVVDATATDTDTIVIDRTPASISSTTAVDYTFGTAINPSGTNSSFYVRISTTDAVDGGGSTVDSGVVAGSTATQIVLTGYMPESLIFCTGGTVSTNGGGVPDCSTATAGSLTFPDFSPSATSFVFSQMAASTNADFGYTITYSGATLTSGSNTITALTSGSTSITGNSQFGVNLVDNATPNVGANLAPASSGTHQGLVDTDYSTADTFRFTTAGDTVANSDFDGSSGPSDSQIYTISYIVNVNGAQPVGTYTTTISYICTATF